MAEEQRVRIRKYQDHLATGGMGVILFGIWTVCRLIMTVLLNGWSYFGEEAEVLPKAVIIAMLCIFTFVVAFIFIVFDLYIGLSAISEGRDGKVGGFYLVICALVVLLKIYSVLFYFFWPDKGNPEDVTISAFILDVTSMIIYAHVFWSGLSLRRIKRRSRRSL